MKIENLIPLKIKKTPQKGTYMVNKPDKIF
jgi:hypothetical protein